MKQELQERMLTTIEKVFHSRKLQITDIVEIIEMARALYDLDYIFVDSNREYKYQLRCMLACDENGTDLRPGKRIMLTRAQYDQMVQIFLEHTIYGDTIPGIKEHYSGSVIRGAIMQDNHYYGHVTFCAKENRVWSDDEKDTLSVLCHFLLIFFGLNFLHEGFDRYEFEIQKFQNETIESGFFLNLDSGKCHEVILPKVFVGKVNEWEDYRKLIELYAASFVDPVYGKKILDTLDIENLRTNLSRKTPIISVDYPRVLNDEVSWYRCVIELIDCDADGNPYKTYFYFQNITNEMQNQAYLSSVSQIDNKTYAVIAALDLDTETYAIYVDNRDNKAKDSEYLSFGGYGDLVQKISATAIGKGYAEQYKEMFSLENLREHFSKEQSSLQYEFPYALGNMVYWVKLEAVKTQHFLENGRRVVLYYSDITEQKKKENELHEISRSLEKEHERVLEVELQAMIDPLTGIYNRAGFQRVVQQYSKEETTIGFVLIDVDHFKSINDTYGHAFGDEVLMIIAQRLKELFRNEDKAFRLGGDEFAVLLYGCGADAWRSLQMKFEGIHHYLKTVIKKDIPITLSVGFTLSESGYDESLMTLADEALYHTKRSGRAGMTQINKEHKILYAWNDSKVQERRNAFPKAAVIGNWRIEFDREKMQKPCLFLDDTSHEILGISNVLTPEECFDFWKGRIAERHYELYEEMRAKLIATGHAECLYNWKHPIKGEIELRAGAKYSDTKKRTEEYYGYLQELNQSDRVLSYDDSQFLMEAMNRMYFFSLYCNLNTKEYYIVKGNEAIKDTNVRYQNADKTLQYFVEKYANPDERENLNIFLDLDTISERLENRISMEYEFLSTTEFGWCRIRVLPVKWDSKGNLTHAFMTIGSIDKVKKAELERDKK